MTLRQHDAVGEYARVFGHPIYTDLTMPSIKLRQLRVKLLQEEFDETIDAAAIDDVLEVADGLVDTAYIAHGTLHAYGLRYNPRGYATEIVGLGGAMRPYLYAENEFLSRRVFPGQPDALKLMAQIEEWLNRLLVEVRFAARDLGLPPFKALFDEVHAANMRKLGPDGKPIYRADGKNIKPAGWVGPNHRRIFEMHDVHIPTPLQKPVTA